MIETTVDDGHLAGIRVRIIRWAVIDLQPGWTVDSDGTGIGYVRDATGTIVSVDDNYTVPPGTLGTAQMDGYKVPGQISVKWDNGSTLMLTPPDQWELV